MLHRGHRRSGDVRAFADVPDSALNFNIEEKQEEPEETEPVIMPPPVNLAPPSTDCFITVNGKVVVLKGKTKYLFVDILDFYPFDTSALGGKELIMTINGEKCEFTSKICEGDAIALYWQK